MRPVGLDREDDDDGDNEEENIDLSVGRRIFTFAVFFYDALSGGFFIFARFRSLHAQDKTYDDDDCSGSTNAPFDVN